MDIEPNTRDEYQENILNSDKFGEKIKGVINDGDIPFVNKTIGVKQNYIIASSGRLSPEQSRPVINDNGCLMSYCRTCDEYQLYTDMSGDAKSTYGVINQCRRCHNEMKREQQAYKKANGNGRSRPQFKAKVYTSQDIEEYVNGLNKLWAEAPSITLDEVRKLPSTKGKIFIYITKCDTPDDKTMQQIRERLSKPNLKMLVYIGQTNGHDIDYPGSGTNIGILKNEFGIDLRSDGVTRVIDVVEYAEANIKEREQIINTNIIVVGVNILEGSSTFKKTTLSFSIDPHSLEEIEILEKTTKMADDVGMTPEQFTKQLWKFGYNDVLLKQESHMKEMFKR